MIDIGNETKEFHAWLKDKYSWVDNDAKKMMFKSWCARASLETKR